LACKIARKPRAFEGP